MHICGNSCLEKYSFRITYRVRLKCGHLFSWFIVCAPTKKEEKILHLLWCSLCGRWQGCSKSHTAVKPGDHKVSLELEGAFGTEEQFTWFTLILAWLLPIVSPQATAILQGLSKEWIIVLLVKKSEKMTLFLTNQSIKNTLSAKSHAHPLGFTRSVSYVGAFRS